MAGDSSTSAFSWRYLDAEGREAGRSDAFPDRESAEAWMGSSWSGLLERGYEEVALHDDARDRRVYRMGLREA